MRTWMIGILIAVLAAALGVGAAYGGSELLRTYARERADVMDADPELEVECHEGRMPFFGRLPNRMRETLWDRMEQFRDHRLEDSNPER
jgi:hypothetical protein